MKKISILYIGNNLTKKTKYGSTIFLLTKLLKLEKYKVTISSDKLNKTLRFLDMFLTTLKESKKTDYIVIDTYSTLNFYYSLIISQTARLLNIKYIPILHGGNLPVRLKKSPFLSKLIFNNSYKNIAPSNYLKSAFEKEGFKVDFIPNIIEVEKYDFKLRNRIEPKLFWIRAFKEIYNPTLAIRVLLELHKKYPNATLCMVGPFVDKSYLETKELVKENSLEAFVTFTNVLTKEEWHQKSKDFDILINTTNYDNTPVSVIEAMALGLTVVSTNAGGLPYLIENNKDGILVNTNDKLEMTNAIVHLLQNYDSNISRNARKKVESFSWDNNKDKWKQILI